MASLVVMSSMGRLLGGGGVRKYCNMSGGVAVAAAAAASAGRFHPDIGGRLSVTRGGKSSIFTSAGKPSTLPLLMVPPEIVTDSMGGHTTKNSSHYYYNFMSIEKQLVDDDHGGIHKKLFMVKKNKSGPPHHDAICRGSSHGWLAFAHTPTRQIGLFNPFGNGYIPLPPSLHAVCKKCEKEFNSILDKIALSSSPTSLVADHCDVVAISDSETYKFRGLVYCKLGDSSWIKLKGSFERYSDVVYFTQDKRFYAIPFKFHEGPFHLEAWDFSDPCTPKKFLIKPSHDGISSSAVPFPSNPQGWRTRDTPPDENGKIDSMGTVKRYLVEASGELLLVLRNVFTEVGKDGFLRKGFLDKQKNCEGDVDDDEYRTEITVGFSVHKMDWGKNKWEPVESLGDKALFVGLNHSFSVSTKDLLGVMPNSIYFTDDMDTWFHPWGYDTGVYNMEDGFISGILPSSLEEIEQLPVWVLPNPN